MTAPGEDFPVNYLIAGNTNTGFFEGCFIEETAIVARPVSRLFSRTIADSLLIFPSIHSRGPLLRSSLLSAGQSLLRTIRSIPMGIGYSLEIPSWMHVSMIKYLPSSALS